MSKLWFPFRTPAAHARVRLVCLAHAGGSASAFREWPLELPRWVEVAAVQLPGHETRLREPLVRSVPVLADLLATELTALPALPCALYGHSFGSVLAFALAREFEKRAAAPPLRLFLAGGEAPHTPRSTPLSHTKSDEQLIAQLAGIGGTPDKLFDDPGLRALFLPILRADLEASETYECSPEQRVGMPFSVFGGTRDEAVDAQRLQRWPELSRAGGELRWIEGTHFFPRERRSELLASLADALTSLA